MYEYYHIQATIYSLISSTLIVKKTKKTDIRVGILVRWRVFVV